MISIHAKSHIGPDGVLELQLPTELADADVEVMVILSQIQSAEVRYTDEAGNSEWQEFIRETAGGWQGRRLVRGEQGSYEERDSLG